MSACEVSAVMPSMYLALEMWKFSGLGSCSGWVRTVGWTAEMSYFSRSPGTVRSSR